MASFTVTGTNTTSQTLESGELGVVMEDSALLVANGQVSVAAYAGSRLYVAGTILNTNNSAVWTSPHDGILYLNVAEAGTIVSFSSYGISVNNRGSARISNAGTIEGATGVGVSSYNHVPGLEIKLFNAGTIIGTQSGVRLLVGEGTALVQNDGLISGERGLALIGLDTSPAEKVFQVVNTGTISGVEYGVLLEGVSSTLRNSGLIEGDVLNYMGTLSLLNSGTISGNLLLSDLPSVTETVRNSGEIHGDIRMNAGADVYSGAGGSVFGTVYGGDGADTLTGGADADVFYGDAGTDLLYGGGGDDLLAGGLDADTLIGDAGSDTVNGGSADDRLYGGAGDDLMIGGGGRDIFFGGGGADTFLYVAAGDSTAAASDVVGDFGPGDLIDLGEVFPGELLFMGTGAFATGGAASVRYQVAANGTAVVFVDVDGDRAADMRILLFDTPALTSDHFLL